MRWILPVFMILVAFLFAAVMIWLIPDQPQVQGKTTAKVAVTASHGLCDETLWTHVYTGDPRKYQKPQDRLQIIQNCVVVRGVIETAKAEKDGDWHLRLKLDHPYAQMLNAKNVTEQHGDLVLEPICSNKITQSDTRNEGVCTGFSQTIFAKKMVGTHVEVVGAYVTDLEHGWREIHPVTSITPLN